jgi:DNA-binding transcriptional regulator YhcF (GntR family)
MVQHLPAKPAPRIVTRASLDFIARTGRAIAMATDGDLPGGLALLALLRHRKPAADTSGGEDNPIAVQSLARSLKIPPETMRRAMNRLIARGWCRRVPARGVVISDAALSSPELEALLESLRTDFIRMLVDLKSIGFDFDVMDRASEDNTELAPALQDLADGRSEPAPAADADGRFDRTILDFILRFADSGLSAHGDDYVRSYVFIAIMSTNASPYTQDPDLAWRYATHDAPPPDEARRPVSLSELAQITGIPYETTRRYVGRIAAAGHCVRVGNKGIVIPTAVTQDPEILKTGVDITRRFAQMIGELKRQRFDFGALARRGSAGTTRRQP